MKLDLSGFQPQTGRAFRQCIVNPVNVATDCTTNRGVTAFTDSTGAAEVFLVVFAETNVQLENAGNTGLIACDHTHPCVIAAVTNLTDLTSAVYEPIAFAPAPDDCPNPGAAAVFGSGSATAYRAIYGWQSTVCVPPYSLPVVYAVSNGPDGASTFGLGQSQANFGVTGPLPPLSLPTTAPSYKVAPITGSAVVIAFKIFDRRGLQITNLTLTPLEIAQIFSGELPNFAADPGITALNPGTQFPGVVLPYTRAEHSSETYVLTSWLSATLGSSAWPKGPQTVWPQIGVTTEKSGSRALGSSVVGDASGNNGTIGFMDSSTAAYYGLPTANIKMPSGAVVGATTDAITKGLALATQNPDGTYTPAYGPSAPDAYPMAIPTYMLVPTDQISINNGKVLAAFLRYSVQQGQAILPAGYVPVTADMVKQSLAAADAIPQTQPSPTAAPSGDNGLGADNSFNQSGLGGLGGLGSPRSLGGIGGPTSPQPSATGGTQCSPGASSKCPPSSAAATGSPAPALLVAGSGALIVLIAVTALAGFGVITGPVTYVLARKPHVLRRVKRLLRWRPGHRDAA